MSAFRALLARPRALRLAAASAVGWWAFNGYALALVLTIHHATASFAVAGTSTAAFGVGSAVLAPLRGRAVDRGGAGVLLRLAAVHVCALGVIVAACLATVAPPAAVLVSASVVAGAACPPLTATARRVWAQVAGPDLVRSAHAVNALLGDTAGLASPVATSLIAAASSPVMALAVLLPGTAAAAIGIAGVAHAEATGSIPSAEPSALAGKPRSILRDSPGLRWLVAGDVASGLWLGALEVSAPALGVEADTGACIGAPFVALAVGGIAASLWSGSAHARGTPVTRYVAGTLCIAAVMPIALVAVLSAVCVAAGVGYGLINVGLFELIDHVAEDARATEAFTWITTAQASGLAIGAAAAGVLADADPLHALALAGFAPLLGAAVALTGRARLVTALGRSPRPAVQAQPSA